MIQYDIIVDADQVEAKLAALQGKLLHWGDAMRAVGAAFKQYYATKPFVSRGSIYGTAWPDLQPAYKSWKARKYPGRPILVRTNALAEGFSFMSTTNTVRVFNTVEYFKKHQTGDGVPQRISMAMNRELEGMASQLIALDLQRKVNSI